FINLDLIFFFFFSSRRRHTRFSRDWSSDVCSSDLGKWQTEIMIYMIGLSLLKRKILFLSKRLSLKLLRKATGNCEQRRLKKVGRSEERRVGKECRYRWSE